MQNIIIRKARSSVAMQQKLSSIHFQGVLSSLRSRCASYINPAHCHTSKHSDRSRLGISTLSKFTQSTFPSSVISQRASSLTSLPSTIDFGSCYHRKLTTLTSNNNFYHDFQGLSFNITDARHTLSNTDFNLVYRQFHSGNSYSARESFRKFSSNGKPTGDKIGHNNEKKKLADSDSDSKLTLYQRFKKAYKEHGKVLVVVHLATSAVWFGMFYTAAKSGVDVVPLLESWNLNEKFISPFRSGGLGSMAVAYLMYKLATPARYTVTLGGTNLAIRYLKKEGRMQPIAKEDTLREMYKEGKENIIVRGKKTRGRFRNMRQRLRSMRQRIQGRIRRVRKKRSK